MVSPDEQPNPRGPSAPVSAVTNQVPRKRPGTWDDNSSTAGNRVAKNRAPRACVTCRDRKVRCDVVSGGVPCTNCRLDDVDCILKPSNRGKQNPARQQARSRFPWNTTASALRDAASESAPDSASATVLRSGSGHGSVATGQAQERRGSRPLAHGDEGGTCDGDEDEDNSRHGQQEGEQTRTTYDAQVQANGRAHEARREQQPQPRPNQRAVMRSMPTAQPANPPTSDDLVALAFQGRPDAQG